MTPDEKFAQVMLPLMKGESDRLMDDVFGTAGHRILSDFEEANNYKITPYGSWSNQAGLTYIPAGVIAQDRQGYFFTGVPADSAEWKLARLPKGMNLKWISKNFPSLESLIEEVFELRERVRGFSVELHLQRQPEFSVVYQPGFSDQPRLRQVLRGIERPHITDAQLLGARTGETMMDTFLTTATAHRAHSFFSSENFTEAAITATKDSSGNLLVQSSVVNPGYYHGDCVRQDVLLTEYMTPDEVTGILKMFSLRKVLQQTRKDILLKWDAAQAEKQKAA